MRLWDFNTFYAPKYISRKNKYMCTNKLFAAIMVFWTVFFFSISSGTLDKINSDICTIKLPRLWRPPRRRIGVRPHDAHSKFQDTRRCVIMYRLLMLPRRFSFESSWQRKRWTKPADGVPGIRRDRCELLRMYAPRSLAERGFCEQKYTVSPVTLPWRPDKPRSLATFRQKSISKKSKSSTLYPRTSGSRELFYYFATVLNISQEHFYVYPSCVPARPLV